MTTKPLGQDDHARKDQAVKSHRYEPDDAPVVWARRCRVCGLSHRDPIHSR